MVRTSRALVFSTGPSSRPQAEPSNLPPAALSPAVLGIAPIPATAAGTQGEDLSALAAQIIDELRAEQPERQVAVDIQPQMLALADRNLMRIVLDNLLRNAWKFSARQPQARINFWVEHHRDRKIYCVRDNGAGFDMAYAANLFRPFHRLHSEQDFAGTGIGLATVQRIIARHGGAVWARSRPGEGAQFFSPWTARRRPDHERRSFLPCRVAYRV